MSDICLAPVDNRAHLDYLERIYTDSFPECERRLWAEVVNPVDPAGPGLLGVFRNDELVGLVTLWHFDGFDYMEHFAIDPDRRSGGIGSSVLKELSKLSDRPLVIEVEPPESSDEATRRIGFYTRNGFEIVSTTYIQPPYRPGLPEVPLYIMSTQSDRVGNVPAIESTLHRHVYHPI